MAYVLSQSGCSSGCCLSPENQAQVGKPASPTRHLGTSWPKARKCRQVRARGIRMEICLQASPHPPLPPHGHAGTWTPGLLAGGCHVEGHRRSPLSVSSQQRLP
ncbi:hypothetical protein KIL84_021229 [Mauremys mutica]|uniref:Uncharacterized protein n=1 Tax=Mauremys mutica TaxID=74926 RepID=A0A9D3XCF9_9SAUR|nr:hypothetical protein KIL84_021229 [Mauremys mutica]